MGIEIFVDEVDEEIEELFGVLLAVQAPFPIQSRTETLVDVSAVL